MTIEIATTCGLLSLAWVVLRIRYAIAAPKKYKDARPCDSNCTKATKFSLP